MPARSAPASAHRLLALLPFPVRPPLPHVGVAHVHPRRVVRDAVHDGVGVDATAEPRVPVLLPELRAEDRRARPVAQLHELQQHASEQLVGPLEQPLVDYEQAVRAVLAHELPLAAGPLAAFAPQVLEVGLANVARLMRLAHAALASAHAR